MINKPNLQILESKQKLAINVLVGVCTLCSCNSMMAMESTPGGPSKKEGNIHTSSNIHTFKGCEVGGERTKSPGPHELGKIEYQKLFSPYDGFSVPESFSEFSESLTRTSLPEN